MYRIDYKAKRGQNDLSGEQSGLIACTGLRCNNVFNNYVTETWRLAENSNKLQEALKLAAKCEKGQNIF
jgi:hypothetical protein